MQRSSENDSITEYEEGIEAGREAFRRWLHSKEFQPIDISRQSSVSWIGEESNRRNSREYADRLS